MSDAIFEEIARNVWTYRHPDTSTSGLILGDEGAVVVDCPPAPEHAEDLARRAAQLTDRPVQYAVVTHYHASRWVGLDAFPGAKLITTRKCATAMLFRGGYEPQAAAMRGDPGIGEDIAAGRRAPEVAMTFKSALSIFLGHRKIDILHFGRGHTTGDAVVWVQDADAMFVGDLVERGVAPFLGDASFSEWLEVLDKLTQYRPARLVPGRGAAGADKSDSLEMIAWQRAFVDGMWKIGAAAAQGERPTIDVLDALEREAPAAWLTLPEWRTRAAFSASRIRDAANGVIIPQIWTPERIAALQAEIDAA